MADKTIGELPGVTSLDSDSLFVAQQQGVASKVTGAQLTQFANVETAAQVAAAQAAAEGAAASETAAETAKNGAETAQTAIENMTVEAETLAAGAQATVQKIVTSGQPIKLLFGLPTGPTGPAGGVDTFNGRTGAVMPAAGDYTAAMVGAAPEGYGLGDRSGKLITDCNEAVLGGFYEFGAGAVNTPELIPNSQYATLLVVPSNANTTQLYYNSIITCYMAVRIKSNSGWEPWEYINPPVFTGVEYRTVERWDGTPVYVQLVYCGQMADGAEIEHGIENVNYVIRYEGTTAGMAMPRVFNHSLSDIWTSYVALVDKTKIGLASGTSAIGNNVYVTIWYTKTGE